jgi:hypothetical protein
LPVFFTELELVFFGAIIPCSQGLKIVYEDRSKILA